jgi:hypothetical protein
LPLLVFPTEQIIGRPGTLSVGAVQNQGGGSFRIGGGFMSRSSLRKLRSQSSPSAGESQVSASRRLRLARCLPKSCGGT